VNCTTGSTPLFLTYSDVTGNITMGVGQVLTSTTLSD
jgi:hypothetical protein